MRDRAVNVGGRMVPPSEAGTQGAAEADRILASGSGGGGGGGGGGGSQCFPAGTMVLTPNGYCDIAELKKGDVVSSVDVGSTDIHSRSILKAVSHGLTKLWSLRLDNGTVLRTTKGHSFYSEGRWKKVSRIEVGDTVCFVNSSGLLEYRRILESAATDEKEKVFNIIVEENFNFVVEGVVAHSFTHFRSSRQIVWRYRASISRDSSPALCPA